MKLVFHTEMLPRVMLRHMYNFSYLLPSSLCSVKFSGQAHSPSTLTPPPPPPGGPFFKIAACSYIFVGISCELHSVELEASCSRVNDKSVGKRERKKFRYRGNNVTVHLLTPTHTEWYRIPSFGKHHLRLTPAQFATKHICLTEHHV